MLSPCDIRMKERINEDRRGISAQEAVPPYIQLTVEHLVYDFMDPSKSEVLGDSSRIRDHILVISSWV